MNIPVVRDAEGYLVDPGDWNKDIAIELAKEEGIELNDTYWEVLNFMQESYMEHDIAPDVRHLIRHLATVNKCNKTEAKKIVLNCFHTVM